MFKSLIHGDPALGSVDKLFYLKSHMQGEAKVALSILQITAANYTTAWEILEQRYDNQRLLVQDHLKAIKGLRPLKEESASGLQSLQDELKRHREQLRALNRPVDSWDDWLVSFASDAMDPVTRRNWEEELEVLDNAADGQHGLHPTFDTLSTFLERRCRTFQALELARGAKNRLPRSSRNRDSDPHSVKVYATTATAGPGCAACGGPHYTGHCAEFRRLPTRERRAVVN